MTSETSIPVYRQTTCFIFDPLYVPSFIAGAGMGLDGAADQQATEAPPLLMMEADRSHAKACNRPTEPPGGSVSVSCLCRLGVKSTRMCRTSRRPLRVQVSSPY